MGKYLADLTNYINSLKNNNSTPNASNDSNLNTAIQLLQNSLIYNSFVDKTSDLYCVLDSSGVIKSTNTSQDNITNYKEEELVGKNFYSLISNKDSKRILATFGENIFTNDKVVSIEYRLVTKEDKEIWVETRGIALNVTGEPVVVVITRDISKRKEVELLLTESTQKFKKLFEVSQIGMAIVSLDGKWIDVNSSLLKMLGYQKEELLTKTFQELTHPDDLEADLKQAKLLGEMKIPSYTLEKRYIKKDGGTVWAILSGVLIKNDKDEPLYFLAQVEDITTTKTYIHDLQTRENELIRFKKAVDYSFNHIIITDADGIILFANKAAERMTGYSFEEMKHNTPRLWGQQMPKEFYKLMWTTIKDNKKPFHGEITNKRKNGETYVALSSISPILDDYNQIIGFLGIEEDITKIKELDKMKSEFLSIAAHQLRPPLGSIRWNLDSLYDGSDGELNEKQRSTIKMCLDTNVHLLGLINDLLDVARIDEGKVKENPENININDIITKITKEYEAESNSKNIKINLSFANDNIFLFKDPLIFTEILNNLISNAIKYNVDSGKIDISVLQVDNFVEIKVTDTGIGIPESAMSKVFERFYRAENALRSNIQGSGLGLYVIKKYVEGWGGNVYLESSINKGSSFTIKIPTST